jgi:hypothetical protein
MALRRELAWRRKEENQWICWAVAVENRDKSSGSYTSGPL